VWTIIDVRSVKQIESMVDDVSSIVTMFVKQHEMREFILVQEELPYCLY
jgi:hypothetical protein